MIGHVFSDGTGYVEDGREIFDDEDGEEEYEDNKKRDKSKKKENKKRLRDVNKPVDGNGSIRSMFGNAVVKKKEIKVKLDEDDILAGILGEINPNDSKQGGNATNENGTKASATSNKLNEKTEMALVKDYLSNLSKAAPRKTQVKTESVDDDVSIDFNPSPRRFLTDLCSRKCSNVF